MAMASTKLNTPAGGGVIIQPASSIASDVTVNVPSVNGTLLIPGQSSAITSGTAVASTSGTSIDFTGIPSWVKRITVMFADVSTNGSSVTMIQVGSGSLTTSGYLGATTLQVNGAVSTGAPMSTGHFLTAAETPASVLHGKATIELLGNNTYVITSTLAFSDGPVTAVAASRVVISGVLDRVRIAPFNGTDAFDAGSINILYE